MVPLPLGRSLHLTRGERGDYRGGALPTVAPEVGSRLSPLSLWLGGWKPAAPPVWLKLSPSALFWGEARAGPRHLYSAAAIRTPVGTHMYPQRLVSSHRLGEVG